MKTNMITIILLQSEKNRTTIAVKNDGINFRFSLFEVCIYNFKAFSKMNLGTRFSYCYFLKAALEKIEAGILASNSIDSM